MNEINISKITASRIVKEYYNNYYNEMFNIKTKTKVINNDLYIVVKKQMNLKGKNISLTETLNQGAISDIIKKYMKKNDCYIDQIIFDQYFHNLCIRYHGNEFEIYKNKRGYEKVLVA